MASSPAMTFNAVGDILASATIAASGTRTADIDASAKFELQLQISLAFGTVAATSGLQVDLFRRLTASPTNDTIASFTFVIPSTASTTKVASIAVPTGKWHLLLTNLDGTNSVTVNTVTSATVDSVG